MAKTKAFTKCWHFLIRHSRNPFVPAISLLLKVASFVAMGLFAYAAITTSSTIPATQAAVSNKDIIIGFVLVFLALVLTTIRDISALADGKMTLIPFGINQGATDYDILRFFDEQTTEATIFGLNLRPVLEKQEVQERLIKLLNNNASVNIVLATLELNAAIGDDGDSQQKNDFRSAVEQLNIFEKRWWDACQSDDRRRLRICFHKDAASLSGLIRDPDDFHRGAATVTVKWATDRESRNRMFFVTTRWESAEFLNRVNGPVDKWFGAGSQNLADVCKTLGIDYHHGGSGK